MAAPVGATSRDQPLAGGDAQLLRTMSMPVTSSVTGCST